MLRLSSGVTSAGGEGVRYTSGGILTGGMMQKYGENWINPMQYQNRPTFMQENLNNPKEQFSISKYRQRPSYTKQFPRRKLKSPSNPESEKDQGIVENASSYLQTLFGDDQVQEASYVKKTTITEDAEDPAVVFFPTNQDSECMDGASGGGFNTFGFIAMMLAAYNLIGLVSNNGNMRNNNNINRNNDNNNNNQNINEANTDTMNMNTGSVTLAPLPPGRMLNFDQLNLDNSKHKREVDDKDEVEEDFANLMLPMIIAWIRFYLKNYKNELSHLISFDLQNHKIL